MEINNKYTYLGEIYVSHYDRMKRFACRYVIEEEDAENIVHDVFLELLEKKEFFPFEINLIAFLFTSLRNKCIDFLRHQLNKQRTIEHLKEEQTIALQLNLNSLEDFSEELFKEKDIETLISKAIDNLPEKCREIFILSKIKGKKQKEIARDLNISINTVETQMGLAYKRLKEELKNYLPLLLFLL
ncbi:RNA polymerase sigma-70 factor [Parabacteroides sp. Marseille-P3160]|uniref:RNA polymerase sigma-70 factor n=1 Tax=Parabacteroides sp. Marseille-P3160 TaxID=1917887 RepID=UPI0009BBFDCB|nr:RNA polymerase sigma-70 factor [Parabacteroides sp. Marseille-P3160]